MGKADKNRNKAQAADEARAKAQQAREQISGNTGDARRQADEQREEAERMMRESDAGHN
ncbi:hypothetical protein [Streptomyces sp. CBMA152]|uniref:hypothetical protein n=1 Tax=Streptomyces sp. CBMA152 TaxID=1896312 RepID=UPI00166111EF|nr:hypothetical protein [Streptomyces sp. CBMA152]